ncbi:MAG: class I tRNA ligase family protein, partial [Erysipelotrichia bacterium]|nr:class I tRNA ligase family protein [Erysipelotrichia bacterium]
NVVNPDAVIEKYGADTLRLYEMFMGPLEASLPWSENGLEGARRFIERVYRLFTSKEMKAKHTFENNRSLEYVYHFTIKKVSDDFASLQFNTAIAQLMVFVNECYSKDELYLPYLEGFLKLFACVCPFIGEELWSLLGYKQLITYASWPTYSEDKLILEKVTIAISINGKLRGTLEASLDENEDKLKEDALQLESVKRHLEGQQIKKIIVVKNKIINIVV